MQNRDHITWMELAQACKALALQEVVSATLEDQLRALFAQVDPDDLSLFDIFATMESEPIVDYRTHMLLDESDCRLMLVLLQEGREVGLHNHPKQHGFIYCYRGSVLIEAFDEHAATAEEAILKRTLDAVLDEGQDAYLTPEKSNIHRLFGTERACLIDVFIPPLQDSDEILCRRYENPYEELEGGLCRAKIIPPPLPV